MLSRSFGWSVLKPMTLRSDRSGNVSDIVGCPLHWTISWESCLCAPKFLKHLLHPFFHRKILRLLPWLRSRWESTERLQSTQNFLHVALGHIAEAVEVDVSIRSSCRRCYEFSSTNYTLSSHTNLRPFCPSWATLNVRLDVVQSRSSLKKLGQHLGKLLITTNKLPRKTFLWERRRNLNRKKFSRINDSTFV